MGIRLLWECSSASENEYVRPQGLLDFNEWWVIHRPHFLIPALSCDTPTAMFVHIGKSSNPFQSFVGLPLFRPLESRSV